MSRYWKDKPNYWATITVKQAPLKCCGLIEISNVGCTYQGEGEVNLKYLLKKYVITSLGYIVTLVSPRLIKIFKEFGFTEIYTFINPNTSNQISILIYKK